MASSSIACDPAQLRNRAGRRSPFRYRGGDRDAPHIWGKGGAVRPCARAGSGGQYKAHDVPGTPAALYRCRRGGRDGALGRADARANRGLHSTSAKRT